MTKQRADRLLVTRGLFESRARAQAAIAAGLVRADGVTLRKSSDEISEAAAIEAEAEHPYVSRGGLKLAAMAGLIAPYPTFGEASKRAAASFFLPKLFNDRTRRLLRLLAKLG